MQIHTHLFEDKIEFFEDTNLQTLEKRISEKIEDNLALMLNVHHVSHHVTIDPSSGQKFYSAVVHFKQKK